MLALSVSAGVYAELYVGRLPVLGSSGGCGALIMTGACSIESNCIYCGWNRKTGC